MAHYLRNNRRIDVIKDIITPFQLHLVNIKNKCEENGFWYWDTIYADDMEHHVGTVFIILQNYINSSISDLFPNLSDLYPKYRLDKEIHDSTVTRIQLIIAIANYYKHRDLPKELHKQTAEIFYKLNIEVEDKIGSSSPIFEGFSLLSDLWNFNDLINIVSDWRENLWLIEEEFSK